MKSSIAIIGMLLVFLSAGCCQKHNTDVVMDLADSLKYKEQQVYELEETRKQLMAMLPGLAKGKSKEDVIKIAKLSTDDEPFEKDGCVWVGWVGFKFDDNDSLIHVSPMWNDGEIDPCFP